MGAVEFLHDLRGGVRALRASPMHTAIAVLTIALGIGLNTVMFSAVSTIVVRPLPYRDPGALVAINADLPGMSLQNIGFSVPEIDDLARRTDVIEQVTAPQTPMPNIFVDGHYGYGLMIAKDRGVLVYEHGGTLPGFSSILRLAPERRVGIALLTNLDNAPLRRIAQVVLARALGLPDTAAPVRTESAVTVDEMKPYLGRYENRGTAELAERDGKVVLILDEGPPLAVSRIGEHRYLGRPKPDVAGPEFVLQPATAASPAYLHFALWAYVRKN